MAKFRVDNNLFLIEIESPNINYGTMQIFKSENYRLEQIVNHMYYALGGKPDAYVDSLYISFHHDIDGGKFGTIASTIADVYSRCKFTHITFDGKVDKKFYQKANLFDETDEDYRKPMVVYKNDPNMAIFLGERENDKIPFSKITYDKPILTIDKHSRVYDTFLDLHKIYEKTNIKDKNIEEFNNIIRDTLYLRNIEIKDGVNLTCDFSKDKIIVASKEVNYEFINVGFKRIIDKYRANYDNDGILDFVNKTMDDLRYVVSKFNGNVNILAGYVSKTIRSFGLTVEFDDLLFRESSLHDLFDMIDYNMDMDKIDYLNIASFDESNPNMIYYNDSKNVIGYKDGDTDVAYAITMHKYVKKDITYEYEVEIIDDIIKRIDKEYDKTKDNVL